MAISNNLADLGHLMRHISLDNRFSQALYGAYWISFVLIKSLSFYKRDNKNQQLALISHALPLDEPHLMRIVAAFCKRDNKISIIALIFKHTCFSNYIFQSKKHYMFVFSSSPLMVL